MLKKDTGEEIPLYKKEVEYVEIDDEELPKSVRMSYRYRIKQHSYRGSNLFIWFLSDVADKLTCLSPSEISCYAMLATYLGKDGYLVKSKNSPLTKSELKDILGLSRSKFYRLYNKFVMYSLIWDKEDKIYTNPNIFFSGELKKKS